MTETGCTGLDRRLDPVVPQHLPADVENINRNTNIIRVIVILVIEVIVILNKLKVIIRSERDKRGRHYWGRCDLYVL